MAISLVAPIVVGRLLRSRAALNRALREKAALLERRREEAAGRAVVDERTRIAGELHDVVAHALSAMTVQATGARRLALTRPGARARRRSRAIESAGREALDELRRLLGVLRREDAELDARAAAVAAPSWIARCGAPRRRACRSRSGSRASGASCPPASTSPPIASSRTRWRRRSSVGGAGRAEVRLRFAAAALEVESCATTDRRAGRGR